MTGNTLISAVVTVLVVVLILYLVDRLPVDGRLRNIIRIVIVVIGIISLVRLLGVL